MAARKPVRRTTRTKKARVRNVSKAPAVTQHLLAAGKRAPDFTLKSTPDQSVSLSEFRGRPVILAFYPADWSPTCGDQLALYNEVLPEFQRYNAELIGISVDGAWCHAAYAKARNLHFPLLADFEPKGAVAKAYGAYTPAAGMSGRALFVLDGTGTIRWSYLSAMGVNPGADGILAALESLGPAGRPAARRAAQPAARDAAAKHRAEAPAGRPAVRTEAREAR
jgi:peroxiredoxin